MDIDTGFTALYIRMVILSNSCGMITYETTLHNNLNDVQVQNYRSLYKP